MSVTLHHGDCLEVLRTLPACSVDACVTDPPYDLTVPRSHTGFLGGTKDRPLTEEDKQRRRGGFMGKAWDGTGVAFQPETWAEVLRVLKPGGHLLSFGGSRTYHRMTCAIEDAGFEIRDCIVWHHAVGFPKSLDVSKAIDRLKGAEREVVGYARPRGAMTGTYQHPAGPHGQERPETNPVTAPATPEAQQWEGFGSALKPASEFICLARRPLSESSIAANVLKHGTGALNIDGTRIGGDTVKVNGWKCGGEQIYGGGRGRLSEGFDGGTHIGRWPANVCFSHKIAPVMRLTGNLPACLVSQIEGYFDGYSRVSELRAGEGNDAFQAPVRSDVLRRGVQEGGGQNERHARQSDAELSSVQPAVSCPEGVGAGRPAEVLRAGLHAEVSSFTAGGVKPSLGPEAYSREPAEDVRDVDFPHRQDGASPLVEGRGMRERRVSLGDDCHAEPGGPGVSASNEGEPALHTGTPAGNGSHAGPCAGAGGGGSSRQRSEERQPAGESGRESVGPSFSGTPADRAETGRPGGRGRTLEVFAEDVPEVWLRYFEFTGEAIECNGSCVPGCPVGELDRQSGVRRSGVFTRRKTRYKGDDGNGWTVVPDDYEVTGCTGGDTGGASRFFAVFRPDEEETSGLFRFVSKPSRRERDAGCESLPEQLAPKTNDGLGRATSLEKRREEFGDGQPRQRNHHPTVKPVQLLRYLSRLITPPNGTVLDPFTGSGTTGIACIAEGFSFVGIEREAEYVEIARRRLEHAETQAVEHQPVLALEECGR